MKQWTIEYNRDNPARSKVFFDDEPLEGIQSVDINISAGSYAPILTLKILATHLEIENKDPDGEE